MSAEAGPSAAARTFVGLPLGAELGETVAARVAAVLPRAEWRLARPAGLHATLAFLGPVARERLPGLGAGLAAALAGQRAPALRLGAGGVFPGLARPRVLWVGAEERGPAGDFERCRRAVVGALLAGGIDLGDELARPFRPHVTVARPRGARTHVPEAFRALALGLDWQPAAVVLYESVPAPGGSRYEPLGTWPLAGADGIP
ncbi:MAG TPA: RNA 2',3'-cyclic phosphodiesterase [Planctomycetota bacterium]